VEPAAVDSPALTAYQRAYLVVCEDATEGPPTDAPTRDPRPLVEVRGWQQGFCRGGEALAELDQLTALDTRQMRDAAEAGDRAREALTGVPPDCGAVDGTPVERFCP
jgi:hypothetical protein